MSAGGGGGNKRSGTSASGPKKNNRRGGGDEGEKSVIEAREDSLDGMTGGVHTLTFNPAPPRTQTDDAMHAPHIGPGGTRLRLVDRTQFPRSAYPDHLPIEGPGITPETIRDFVIYTVPSRALKPDAVGWGDFNVMDNPENFELLRSFSFFMYALEKHNCRSSTRVFAEAIVCNRGEMKLSVDVKTGKTDVKDGEIKREYVPYKDINRLLTRNNLAGFRIWVLFSCQSVGPETMMRRAVIDLQGEVKYVTNPAHMILKRQFATIIEQGYRDKAIAEYIEAKTQEAVMLEMARLEAADKKSGVSRDSPKRKPKAKRRKSKKKAAASAFLDDEAGGGSDDDEDDPREEDEGDLLGDGQDESVDVKGRLKIELYKQFFVQVESMVSKALKMPQPNSDINHYKNTRQKLLWHQHVTVGGSLANYLRRFILPIHAATRTADEWKINRAERAVYGEWPDCIDFAKLDETYLAVYNVLDFQKSAAVLEDIGSRGIDATDDNGPCPVQTAAIAYGLEQGEIYFPFRDLVWELDIAKLGAVSFLSQKFCWGALQFADMLTACWTQIHEHERLTKSTKIATKGIYVPKEPEARATHDLRSLAMASSRGARAAYMPVDELEESLRASSRSSINERRLRDMAGAPKRAASLFDETDPDPENSIGAEDDAPQLPGLTDDHEKLTMRERLAGDIAYLDLNPNRGDVVSVIENAFAPEIRSNDRIKKDLRTVTGRLPLPPALEALGVDLGVYRRTMLMRLTRARHLENFDKIMAKMAEGRETSDIQNQLYSVLSADGSVQHRQVFTIVPGASIHANMLIADATILQVGTGVHHGIEHYHHALTMVLSAADPQPRRAQQASITLGAPATGKSMLWALLAMVMIEGSTTETGHTSELDGFNASRVGTNSVQVMDEMGPVFSRQTVDVQAANADKIAKLKSRLSENCLIASRLGWTETANGKKAITERTVRDLHQGVTGNVNSMIMGPGGDTALATRHCVAVWMTPREESVSVVDKINDHNRQARLEFWRSTKPLMVEEQAMAIFITVLYRCGVIDSINTDVISLVSNTALSAGARWFPQVFANIRANLRHEEFGHKGMIRTAVWRMMRSQASPLLTFSANLDEIIGSRSLDIRDIAEYFSPHLYSTYEDAIAALVRMLLIDLSPDMWLLIRTIASIKGNFRREHMKRVWRSNGIDTIDDEVARIMKERGDVFHHPAIVDMDKVEATLDFITGTNLAENPLPGQTGPVDEYGPKFARFWDTVRGGSQPQAPGNGRFGGPRRSASYDGSGDDDFASDGTTAMPGGCDPNWIPIGASYGTIAESCMQILSQMMSTNSDVTRSVLSILATKTVRVPVFNLVRGVEPTLCKLSSITVQRDSNGNVRYDNVPIVKIHHMGKGIQEVRVSTGALMMPPAHLLFVMLTSGENQFTRPVTTVLPMMVRGFPGHFYPWDIKPRKNVTLSIINHSSNTSLATLRQRQMPIFRDSGILDAISKTQVTINDDFEKIYFEKHMRESHREPEYKEWLSMLRYTLPAGDTYIQDNDLELKGLYPTPEQYEKMMRHWIDHSDAQPGCAEARVRYLYQNSAVFAGSASLLTEEYPRTDIAMERTKFLVLNMCKEAPAVQMPRSSENSSDGATARNWAVLHKVSNYVKCLEWKLFGGDWHDHLLQMNTAKLFTDVLVRISDDVHTGRQAGDAIVPARPLPIPAELADFIEKNTTMFSSKKAKDVDSSLLASFYGPEHMDFLDRFFTARQALRETSLALTVDPALSISQAFDFAMSVDNRDAITQMNGIIVSRKISYATASSLCNPGQEVPMSAMPNQAEYERYLQARDRIRGMRAAIYAVIFTEHSGRVYRHAVQMDSASGKAAVDAFSALALDEQKRRASRELLLGTSISTTPAAAAAAAAVAAAVGGGPASVLGSAPPDSPNDPADSLPAAIGSLRPRYPDASAARPYKPPAHMLRK